MFCFALLSFIFLPHQCRWPISNAFGFCLGLLSFPLEVRSLNFWNGTISKCNIDIFFEDGFVFHLKCLMKIPIWHRFLCCGCIQSSSDPVPSLNLSWFLRGRSLAVCSWISSSSALLPHPKLTENPSPFLHTAPWATIELAIWNKCYHIPPLLLSVCS